MSDRTDDEPPAEPESNEPRPAEPEPGKAAPTAPPRRRKTLREAAREAAEAEEPRRELEGETVFYEPGGAWWTVAIGPLLVLAVLIMEITGPGPVHWPVLLVFGVVIVGFSLLQLYAARKHVTVRLTDTGLQQGEEIIGIDEIELIYPENRGSDAQDWESAPALGELSAVPRRRKGVGLKLANGKLVQAWARDVERFRQELNEAHLAHRLGMPPRPGD